MQDLDADRNGAAQHDPSNEDPSNEPALTALQRAAAFTSGPEKIPRKTLVVFVVALAVLGLGGILADHFFGGPVGSATTATTAGAYPPPLGTAQVPEAGGSTPAPSVPAAPAAGGSQLGASLKALMGLTRMNAKPAPDFTLTDQDGRSISLSSLRGKVVVMSFFDSACDDICPVMAAELHGAYDDLGSDAQDVAFLTVNTDPLELGSAQAAPAEAADGLTSLPDWQFLTGSLQQLDSVWKSYGVAVEVQTSTQLISHDDALYFIGSSGRLRFRATPFADESPSGTYTLPSASRSAWAAGIADQVKSLLRSKA